MSYGRRLDMSDKAYPWENLMRQQCLRFRLRRLALRMKQTHFAKILGCEVNLVRKWENHKRLPNARQWRAWEFALIKAEESHGITT